MNQSSVPYGLISIRCYFFLNENSSNKKVFIQNCFIFTIQLQQMDGHYFYRNITDLLLSSNLSNVTFQQHGMNDKY